MLQGFVRWLILGLVRLFYPRIELQGQQNIPTSGPVIFVLNHPNGLLDPLLLIATLRRRVSFLAKNTLFNNPLGRLCMAAFDAQPVYRQRDAAPNVNTQALNDKTFARCAKLLQEGIALALFPEGTTHSEGNLLPLRTGAARLALSAENTYTWQMGVQMVPIGLWYQQKGRFRSSVLLVIGKSFSISEHQATYSSDVETAVDNLTAQIATHLGDVVLQANNAELLRGIPVVAAWTVNHAAISLPNQRAETARLLKGYHQLAERDPERLASLTEQARSFAQTLQVLGIRDPWALELSLVTRKRLLLTGVLLLLLFPLAAAGFLLSYGPYRLAGLITPHIIRDEDQLMGTVKLVAGSGLVLIGWIIAAVVIGVWLGAWWGWLVFLLAPLLGYSALRWGETFRALREGLSATWLRLFRRSLAWQLIERRQALTEQIATAMQSIEAPSEIQPA